MNIGVAQKCFPLEHSRMENENCENADDINQLVDVSDFCRPSPTLPTEHEANTIAKIIVSRLPGLSEKSSAVIGQFVITTAVRGYRNHNKRPYYGCLFWFGYPPSRELETN